MIEEGEEPLKIEVDIVDDPGTPEAEPESAPEPVAAGEPAEPVTQDDPVQVVIEREELVEIASPPAALHVLIGEVLAGLPGTVDDLVAVVHEQFAAHRLFCLQEVVYDRQERGRVSAKVRYQLVGPTGDSLTSTSYGQGATTGDAIDDAFHSFLTQTFVLSARRPAPAPTQAAAVEPVAAVTEPDPAATEVAPAPVPPKKTAIATPPAAARREPPPVERPPQPPSTPASQEPEPAARVAPPSPPARSSAPGHEPTEDDMICEGSELGYEGCLGRVDTPEQWKFSTFRFRKSLCSVCMPQHNLADKAARKAALEAKKVGTTVVSELS